MKKLFLLPAFLVLFTACATTSKTPNFYPNAYYNRVGQSQALTDTQYCKNMADTHVKRGAKWKDVAGGTAENAVVGTAIGAVGGSIVSNAGRGAGIGAATGALSGLYQGVKNSTKEDPNWEKFVEQCLADKGYKVYGWN